MKTVLNALLFCLILLPATLMAQSTATGTVTDKANAMPLPGVNVIIKGTTRGTSTDFDGKYSIEINKGEVLVFSYVGYTTQEIIFDGQSPINVAIEEDASQLDEVVLIGYGSVKKEDLTGTVDLVTEKDFNDGPIVSAQQLISGKIAGVSVTSSSGAPGEGQDIRIRGTGSLSLNSSPLYVIDGVPIDSDGVGGTRNPLNLINPNDIESITVLKDASAAAIYGSRGANGVIIVTTKKGKNREFTFNLSSSTTVQTYTNTVDVLNADQFRDIITLDSNYDATTSSLLGSSNTNWQDEIYTDAFGQDHSFSARGNAFGVPMRASVSYSNFDGILKGDNFERITGALSFTPQLLDEHLKVELNAKASYTENDFANRDAIGSAIVYDPTQSVYDSSSPFGGYSGWLIENASAPLGYTQISLSPTNPVALLNLVDDTAEVRRFLGNAKFDYKLPFFEDITATVNVGLDKSNSHGRTITSQYLSSSDIDWNGSYTKYTQEATNKLFDAYLTYTHSFKDIHNVNAVAGYSYQSFEYDNYSFDSEDQEDGNQFEFIDKSKNVLLSYFGRLNYDYDGRYLLTASLRADASSKLNPDDRWGYFPSLALAWNITNENFMDNSFFSNLKLRFGYGEIGNVNGLGDYLFLTRYTGSTDTAGYQFGTGFYQTYRPEAVNDNLKWEVGRTINLGLDFSLFNNRVSGLFNAYIRKTEDLIATSTVDPFTNFSNTIQANIGDMENRGLEFALNVIPVKTEDFQWNISYNVAFNDNEVTNLPDDQPTGGISTGTGNNVQVNREGESPYSFYVYKQIYDVNGKPIEGAFADLNGDNVINDDDKYLYKDALADVTMGINTDFRYKNWDLAVVTRASIGNYVYNDVNASKGILSNVVPTTNNYLSNIVSDYYNTGFVNIEETNALSDHFVEDGSFFRIDNITLGYNANEILKGINARFYGSLQNVALFTDYSGIDPEITGGIDNNFYPRPRSFVLGVNFDF
ncbi:SusC/RagA family TonB-linked outer membrane protein [Winogradskyella endarachnes]|uniref:SusC/RagA family TonB-linked outer membrane protein n=1 Tax=Winogradskyella endarachnes TaxID=2681965 RepID=A0A6L6U8S1_9FLAO|nr:TonB-dependent receptor [Winogradskyella endarachnes]MUU78740.1 SusC/RagA family TonB-linked outer membrane protein [Winogradskyella endarachnes]